MTTPSQPRVFVNLTLSAGLTIELPPEATKHVQVLRMQPQETLSLFDGQGGEWRAQILTMGKKSVQVQLLEHHAIEREAGLAVSLLVGIPVNERMDFLVEKATELGVKEIYPLMFQHSVFRMNAQKMQKKQEQWQQLSISACEQCGRNQIPLIHPIMTLDQLLENQLGHLPEERRILSLYEAKEWPQQKPQNAVALLSGPEGGLSTKEELMLIEQGGFKPYRLGSRILRADTAPIAALSTLVL